MNLEKFTDRAKGFLQSAQTVAIRLNHQRITPEHILKALLEDNEGMAAGLIGRAGGNVGIAQAEVDKALAKDPSHIPPAYTHARAAPPDADGDIETVPRKINLRIRGADSDVDGWMALAEAMQAWDQPFHQKRRTDADGAQDSIFLGVHRVIGGGVMVIVAAAVQQPVHRVEHEFAFDAMAKLRRATGGFVNAGDDVNLDRFSLIGAQEGQDIRRSGDARVTFMEGTHRPVIHDLHMNPGDRHTGLREDPHGRGDLLPQHIHVRRANGREPRRGMHGDRWRCPVAMRGWPTA